MHKIPDKANYRYKPGLVVKYKVKIQILFCFPKEFWKKAVMKQTPSEDEPTARFFLFTNTVG